MPVPHPDEPDGFVVRMDARSCSGAAYEVLEVGDRAPEPIGEVGVRRVRGHHGFRGEHRVQLDEPRFLARIAPGLFTGVFAAAIGGGRELPGAPFLLAALLLLASLALAFRAARS